MLIATCKSWFLLLPPNSQDVLEEAATLHGAVTGSSAHLKPDSSTQPSCCQPTSPARPPLCERSECQKHQLSCSRFWCCFECKRAANVLLWSIYYELPYILLISLKCFVLKDFLAVKESLMPNLHRRALFWLTYDFGHSTFLFLSLHEYIQYLGYLLHVKIFFF